MKTNISEELPARKHAAVAPAAPAAPAAKEDRKAAPAGKKEGGGSSAENSEKRVRQAVYDIRYRARREDIDLKQAFAQYMSNSSLSPQERTAVKDKLFGKKPGVSEQYSGDGLDMAVNSIANSLYKVFVEGTSKEDAIELEYQKQLEEQSERVYHVRVTDPKNGRTYTRNATREKISQLRAKGLKVEMSEYRDSRETQKDTAKSANRAKRDYDGDGKVESSSKEHAGAVHNAIQRAKGGTPDGRDTRKEDYIWTEGATGTTSVEGQNKNKITGSGVDNSSRIRVFPDDGSDVQNNGGIIQAGKELSGPFITELTKGEQKFFDLIQEKKLSKKEKKKKEKYVKGMKKSKEDFEERYGEDGESVMHATATKMAKKDVKEENEKDCPKCGKSPCECRAREGYRIALKNKFRALGAKNPIILGDIDHKRFTDIMSKDKVTMKDACG